MGEPGVTTDQLEWCDMRLKSAALARYNLPDILYPLPIAQFSEALDDGGELPFAQMLYALQQRSAEAGADWVALEPALERLASLLAPDDDRLIASAAGEDWWVEIGPVDLDGPIVTIQRRDQLIGALSQREDGRLRLATYHPLDGKSARLIIGLGSRPHPSDGTVCMRPNNWEYALDCSAGSGQWYAFERGEAHLSYWEHGLGLKHDRSIDPHWHALRDQPRRCAVEVAMELGVAYAYSSGG